MSTEHQQYSTENQSKVIRSYAERRGMEVVRTFADSGKSGLNIAGREALKNMIAEVQSGAANFEVILAYDVSRWGRFQDADESAYYEYVCRRSGIQVHYCAEQFENDGSPVSTIIKSVKRAMAGEYSRELSVKVFSGQCRLIELGFRQGGTAGFGLRRMLQDQSGKPKAILNHGEQKSIQTDRVMLVPGPDDEQNTVREIYDLFVGDRLDERGIAARLNDQGRRAELHKPWTKGLVHQVLTNEKYIGNNVYNRRSYKLKKRRVVNPPEMWVRCNAAFEAIVPQERFVEAQAIISERSRKVTNEELLTQLKDLCQRKGTLSALLIDEADGMASSTVFQSRFHGLLRAYQLIGYVPERDFRYIEINRELRQQNRALVETVTEQIKANGGDVERDAKTDLLKINNEFTASIVLARCQTTSAGSFRWRILFDTALCPDITLAVRMNSTNAEVLDYYIFPALDLNAPKLLLAEMNSVAVETYRFEDLSYFLGMGHRTPLAEVA